MWEWADENAEEEIHVHKVEQDKLIEFEWSATGKPTTTVISLEPADTGKTKITIQESEWDNDEQGGKYAMQQMRGWTDFFNSLKAYLLFNVNLRTGERL